MDNERLTLQDIIDLLAEKQGLTKKDAESFLREYIAVISETIGERDFVRVKDFGTFKLTEVRSRKSVDVNTGEAIEIPAHYRLSFAPEKELRERVNKPFSHFKSVELAEGLVFEDETKLIRDKEIEETTIIIKEDSELEKPKLEEVESQEIVEKVIAPISLSTISDVIEEEVVITSDAISSDSFTAEEIIPAENIIEEVIVQEPKKVEIENSIEEKKVVVEDSNVVDLEEESVEDENIFEYKQERSQGSSAGWWIAIVLVVLVAGGIYWWLNRTPEIKSGALIKNSSTIIISDEATTESAPVATIQKEDSTTIGQTGETLILEEEVEMLIEETSPSVVAQETTILEVEVEPGQTMRMLGKEHYGHDAFWVYIFEENKEKIKRPNHISAGMKLKLPPASKYNIDVNDKASVEKAKALEIKLFEEFN